MFPDCLCFVHVLMLPCFQVSIFSGRPSLLATKTSVEPHQPLTAILSKSIMMHLPILSRYFCKSMPWLEVAYTPPICITIRLPFVSRCFCRSIEVRGCWHISKENQAKPKSDLLTCMSLYICPADDRGSFKL